MKRSFDDLNRDEAKDEKAPIKFQDLQPGEAKELFRVLMNGETSQTQIDIEGQASKLECKEWIASVLKAVEKFPGLATVVEVDEERNSSLLENCWYATLELGLSPYAVDAMKTLIKANPYALVWDFEYDWDPLTWIADNDHGPGSESGNKLFLWIFEHYSWVFDQELFLSIYEKNRALYHLISLHLQDKVPASALKEFFNKYPHLLMSRSGRYANRLEGELPIELLARNFVKGSPSFEVMVDIARLMYPKLTKHLTATQFPLIRQILKVLDKEKEVALMSIRLKRAKLLLLRGSSQKKESSPYCCWVKNRLLELQARTKEYEKDIAALKQWDGSGLDS